MGNPKKTKKAKAGPKSDKTKKETDSILKRLWGKDGVTQFSASLEAGCSVPYAAQKFKEFADEAIDGQDEDWIEKNDRVRVRSLQGINNDIALCEERIKKLQTQYNNSKETHDAITGNLIEEVRESEAYDEIANMLPHLDKAAVLKLYRLISNSLNMDKNYGYYLATLMQRIKDEETFKAELKMQYDSIELLPPAKEIIDRMIERRIAEKNNIQPVTEKQQIVEKKARK